jgi:hypothetical protein
VDLLASLQTDLRICVQLQCAGCSRLAQHLAAQMPLCTPAGTSYCATMIAAVME